MTSQIVQDFDMGKTKGKQRLGWPAHSCVESTHRNKYPTLKLTMLDFRPKLALSASTESNDCVIRTVLNHLGILTFTHAQFKGKGRRMFRQSSVMPCPERTDNWQTLSATGARDGNRILKFSWKPRLNEQFNSQDWNPGYYRF